MLVGDGLLALWNGVDPARADEYDLWHTREHVPQRVAVPGMIRALRYVAGDGPLPGYLTLYDLAGLDVLSTAPYRHLLDTPTDWSRSMRPSFRGFLRIACRPLARRGGGTGGAMLATTLPHHHGVRGGEAQTLVDAALAIPAVTGAQLFAADADSPDVPFRIGGDMPDYPRDAVLLLEGYDRPALVAAQSRVNAWLAASPLAGAPTLWTSYALGAIVAAEDLPHIVTVPQPPVTGRGA